MKRKLNINQGRVALGAVAHVGGEDGRHRGTQEDVAHRTESTERSAELMPPSSWALHRASDHRSDRASPARRLVIDWSI